MVRFRWICTVLESPLSTVNLTLREQEDRSAESFQSIDSLGLVNCLDYHNYGLC